jgi:hypothetical protein
MIRAMGASAEMMVHEVTITTHPTFAGWNRFPAEKSEAEISG